MNSTLSPASFEPPHAESSRRISVESNDALVTFGYLDSFNCVCDSLVKWITTMEDTIFKYATESELSPT
jgi:hypothetical protein